MLAVAISQSGKTEEIVETLDWAKDCGARTVAVTNGAGSPLAEAAEVALVTDAGDEIAVPATKTYTTQLAALSVVGLGLGADVAADDLRRVPDEVARVIALAEESRLCRRSSRSWRRCRARSCPGAASRSVPRWSWH